MRRSPFASPARHQFVLDPELIENARVVGGVTPESAKAGRDLYATFVKGRIIETDATTAEMVKLMENTTRDVNIAIANEFSRLAEKFGVDVWEAISLAKSALDALTDPFAARRMDHNIRTALAGRRVQEIGG